MLIPKQVLGNDNKVPATPRPSNVFDAAFDLARKVDEASKKLPPRKLKIKTAYGEYEVKHEGKATKRVVDNYREMLEEEGRKQGWQREDGTVTDTKADFSKTTPKQYEQAKKAVNQQPRQQQKEEPKAKVNTRAQSRVDAFAQSIAEPTPMQEYTGGDPNLVRDSQGRGKTSSAIRKMAPKEEGVNVGDETKRILQGVEDAVIAATPSGRVQQFAKSILGNVSEWNQRQATPDPLLNMAVGSAEGVVNPLSTFSAATGNLYDSSATLEERLGAAGNIVGYALGAEGNIGAAMRGAKALEGAAAKGVRGLKNRRDIKANSGINDMAPASLRQDVKYPQAESPRVQSVAKAIGAGAGAAVMDSLGATPQAPKPASLEEFAKSVGVEPPPGAVKPTAPEASPSAGLFSAKPTVISPKKAETGKPTVVKVFHGSSDLRFTKNGDWSKAGDNYGGSVFFTDNPKIARTYADPRRAWDYQNSEPGVIERYVELKNPKVIDAQGAIWKDTNDAIDLAKAEGHDGIIIKNVRDAYNSLDNPKVNIPATNVVVFDKSRIHEKLDTIAGGAPALNNIQPTPTAPVDVPTTSAPQVNLTAGAIRFTDETRKQFDLPGRTKPEPQKMTQWAEEAQAVDVDELMARIDTAERPTATAPEQIALGVKMSELQDELDALGDQYREAAKKGVIPDELDDRMDSVRSRLQKTIEASEAVGTETSRTFNARKALVKADYTVAGIIKKQVRELKKAGKKASPEDVVFAEAQANRIKELEDKLAALPQEKPTVGERRRAVRKATLEKEAESIINQIKALGEKKAPTPTMRGRQGGAINVGKIPEYVDLYAQYAANLAKRGYSTVDDIFAEVVKVAKEAGHNLSKQELVDAMDGWYLKNSGKKLSAAQKAELKARAKLKKEVETTSTRGQAEAAAKKANPTKTPMTAERKVTFRERALESQIRKLDAQIKAGKAAPSPTKVTSDKIKKLEAIRKTKQAELNKILDPQRESAKIEKLRANADKKAGATQQRTAQYEKQKAVQDATKARRKATRKQVELDVKLKRLETQIKVLNKQAADGSLPKITRDKVDINLESLRKMRDMARREAEKASVDVNMAKLQAEAARKEASAIRKATREAYNDGLSQTALDDAAIARLRAKKDDLDTLLKSGQFSSPWKYKKTSDLSGERDLLQFQVDQAKAQVDRRVQELGKSNFEKGYEGVLSTLRGLKLGLDAGAVLRQGYDVLLQSPKAWAGGIKDGVQSMNKVKASALNKRLLESPVAIRAKKNGVPLDDIFEHGEETFGSGLLNIIPGHSALERFHVATQNGYRLRLYEKMEKIPGLTKDELKAGADFIAAITGRSNLVKTPGKFANTVFTAPKMYAGQFEAMTAWLRPKYNPLNFGRQNRAVKRMVLKRTAARVGILVAAKAVAEQYGWDMSLNPDDADFLKLRKGDTVLEVAGGYTPYYRAFFSTVNNIVSPSRKNKGEILDTAFKEARKKIAPGISLLDSVASGENFVGEPMFADKDGNRTLADFKSWMEAFGTITINDLYDMNQGTIKAGYDLAGIPTNGKPKNKFDSMGAIGKAGVAGAAFLGVGAQSYDKRGPKQKNSEETVIGQILRQFGVSGG